MNEGASRLLRDLAVLLRRYKAEDFEELASLLGRSDFTRALAQLLAGVARADRQNLALQHHHTQRSSSTTKVRAVADRKHVLLRTARQGLLNREIYKTVPDLIRAVESSGVPLPKRPYRRREEIVSAFMRAASEITENELEQAVAKLAATRTASDLRGWTNIIIPKRDSP